MTERQARRAMSASAVVAAISGAATILMALASAFGVWDPYSASTSGWNVIDGVLYLSLAYWIYKGSRGAAIAMLVLHLLSQIVLQVLGGGSVALALVAAAVYANGVVGANALRTIDATRRDTSVSMDDLSEEVRLP